MWGKNVIEKELVRRGGGAMSSPDDKQLASFAKEVRAVITWQPSHLDLSVYPSSEVSVERDRLFVRFRRFATSFREALSAEGHWVEASCPATGGCLFGERGGCTWNELEGLTQLLRYSHIPAGCCGIVLHPEWGKKAYPVTLFTNAPVVRCNPQHTACDICTQKMFVSGCNNENYG